jgi:hypothetical protein
VAAAGMVLEKTRICGVGKQYIEATEF